MTVGDLVEPVFHVTLEEVRAWTSSTKVKLTSIDPEMMSMITAEVIGRLGARYVTQSWVSPETTPEVVRKLICMRYVGWYYLRQFAEADTENDYGVDSCLRQTVFSMIFSTVPSSSLKRVSKRLP